ncbi:MAG TPA: redox-regulated ATPase YchF [Candidatus Nanoarchaeia archaeon]|nr:redox-regulated ATPase YchF [Candidatus Nanoarchaeia archaeon]
MLIGIVGKSNVGKSTFFKAATLMDVLIANYPFATIKPNEGAGFVKIDCVDTFFNRQCNPREGFCVEHKRFVPVKLIDVAGLVPGAHKGLGLGMQFLNDLNQASVLIHVIDSAGTTSEKGEPIQPGTYDPAGDVRFLEIELDYWYLDILKKGWERLARMTIQTKQKIADVLGKQLSGVGVDEKMVEEALGKLGLNPETPHQWTEEQLLQLSTWLRKKTKPMIIACNKADMPTAAANIEKLRKEFPDYLFVPCSAESELALKEAAKAGLIDYLPGTKIFKIKEEGKLSEAQKKGLELIQKSVLDPYGSTGVQDVLNTAVFELLHYKAIYPGGVSKLEDQHGRVLPDCFLMPPATTALDFAFKLHTDFGNNFVKAIDVKKKLPIGKEYVLKHLDVVEIKASK